MSKTGIIILTIALSYLALCMYLRLQRLKSMNACCKQTGRKQNWGGGTYRMLLWEPFMERPFCYTGPEIGIPLEDCCSTGFPENTADGINYTYCKRGDKYYVSGIGGVTGSIPEKETTKEEYESVCKNKIA